MVACKFKNPKFEKHLYFENKSSENSFMFVSIL